MPTPITSLQNPRIKQLARLRDRRGRNRQRQFLIDGVREIQRAIDGGIDITELFVAESRASRSLEQTVLNAKARNVPTTQVTLEVLEKLSFGDRVEGAVAVARTPNFSLDDIRQRLPPDPVVAVLESVEKPGNVGAVVRSADAAGVAAVITTGKGTDFYNPNAIRASLGTVFTMPVCSAGIEETIGWLRENNFAMFAARVDGAVCYSEVEYHSPAALILGSEADGLSENWRGDEITAIKLPMLGAVDSLNISTTAAVLFYETLRQRQS